TTSDPPRAQRNLLERDHMFTERLRGELAELGLPSVEVDGTLDEAQLTDRVAAQLGLGRQVADIVRLIRSAELSDAQYAYASVVESGVHLIFLAGACPLEKDGTTAAVGDYAGQAAKCVETLSEALRAAGATIGDVVSTRVLVASSQRSDLSVVWA